MNQVRSLLGSMGKVAKEPVTLRLAELAVLVSRGRWECYEQYPNDTFLGRVSPQKL